MVVTRSGVSSPASGADTVSADATLRRPASDAAPVQGTLGDVGASRASMVDAPLLMPSVAPGESVAPDGSATPDGVAAPGWSAVPGGSAAAGASAHDAAAAPVVMSTDQLLLLINRLSHGDTVSTTAHTYTGNFAKCTARFDGDKSSNVQAFIDSVLTYKDCVGVNDDIALRGLSMLLTGLAATWWQGVKDSTPTWQDAMEALKQTFGPRSPPHKIYRCIFEREQRVDESTDLFICHLRALFSQLPPFTLSETVQLDMCYGLLHRRIREKVPRTSFNNFGDLLTQARRAEDILEESRARTSTDGKPAVTTYSTVAKPSSPAASSANSHKVRSYCNYCRQYGHVKDDCSRLANRLKKNSKEGESELRATTSTVTCFGCGAPGVIRSNCPTCNNKKNAPTNNNVNAFQSISASGDNFDSRVRPVLNIKINDAVGKVLLDTGAKHSVGSVSLRAHLVKTGHNFRNIFAEFKYADGRVVAQSVEVANVKITVRNVNINVDFVMLPNATESLLGMNFIEDAGMVLDFKRNIWFMECDKTPQPIEFESRQQVLSCSSVGLREDEGAYLNADDRRKLDHLLNEYEDIFRPGGGPTDYAIHRIDTGDAAPIACPPYRVTPAKKEIIKKEIEKMLEEDVIEEAESEWAAPVVLVPKKNGETRFCVDYRKLNSVTRADKYPLPVIDELLQSTKPGCVMSSIDLKSGYWQVLVAPEDRPKTTFTSPFGNFSFKRLPFGLKNAPATFQRLIDRMRSGLKDVCILAYLDDLFVISPNLEQHLKDLQLVFERLRLFNLTANRTKLIKRNQG